MQLHCCLFEVSAIINGFSKWPSIIPMITHSISHGLRKATSNQSLVLLCCRSVTINIVMTVDIYVKKSYVGECTTNQVLSSKNVYNHCKIDFSM